MEHVLEIAQYVLTIGGALAVIIFVLIGIYIFRFVLVAFGIIKTAKKTVQSAEQNIASMSAIPTGLLGSLFGSSTKKDDEFDGV